MGSIPMQRETDSHASESRPSPPHVPWEAHPCARTTLPGTSLAPAAARRFVRSALADWAEPGARADPEENGEHASAHGVTERLADDAAVLVSELVTNAVVHAGTDVEVLCRLEYAQENDEGEGAALLVEVTDHHPARPVHGASTDDHAGDGPEYGRGLHLVASLSESWGITYRTGSKTVWARLPVDGVDVARELEVYAGEQAAERGLRAAERLAPAPDSAPDSAPAHDRTRDDRTRDDRTRDPGSWDHRDAVTFLAEASDLLAGQLDEDLVAALAGQLLVPHLADWCAVWLDDEGGRRTAPPASAPRLARVWHRSENRIEELHRVLEKEPPHLHGPPHSGPVTVPWPAEGLAEPTGTALAHRLVAGGRALGTLLVGRAGQQRFPDQVTGLLQDFSRRVALAVGAARQYTRQATISRVLQRGLLPSSVAEVPGLQTALVYEPRDKGLAGGDFYDVFPAGDGRWCFALGDVCGNGPEAAVVTGLARPWLRLLAREGYSVGDVLTRLNQALLDDAMEAAEAAARAVAAAGLPGLPGPPDHASRTGGAHGSPYAALPHTGSPDTASPSRFLSVLYGELVPTDDGVRCTVACAGHPLPLVLDPEGGVRAAAEPQVILGVLDDAAYTGETFLLRRGETLLLVTDGVTERRDGPRQFDDGDGLAAALATCTGLSALHVAERIRHLVHEFSAEPPDDDLALLVLQAQ
ncbi:SpoIIE family protein phosphatase [Streptomyces sp. B-S-A8]|uniref:SpoIIE family protein phosphatase n=1 Tax=Streptomyces solicavernae TaxID=3043614 RepID=A0ABT6RWA4_9ACTN|nr:SpoIIE family protein phosphatase [Streptomyces sp. B-S-A8]MDI3388620.1 SpoIIE family protein phosphatase [Streptomyces sp. B-S-A8]